MAITSCHEDPYIGLWTAMLGIKQLLVRWHGCKGLNIYLNNRSEETIRHCGGYREVVLGVITSLPKKLFRLTFDNHFRVIRHRNNPSYYRGCPPMDVNMHWQDTHKARMITQKTMWRG